MLMFCVAYEYDHIYSRPQAVTYVVILFFLFYCIFVKSLLKYGLCPRITVFSSRVY
jgi:hypothetical protein